MDFRWKLLLVLAVLELAIGLYFIFASDSIAIAWYIIMGVLTTIAGTIEVVTVMTHENIRTTINDGKKIIQIIKDNS